ncbi:hypothetical protein GGE07_005493 [Sinorhizobium terangae]|nr:hypothetical protein [Sinorhizobium terangae]
MRNALGELESSRYVGDREAFGMIGEQLNDI